MLARPLPSVWFVGACMLLSATACTVEYPESVPTPQPQAPSVTGTLSTEPIWGVADLHAHPASHLAYGGLNGHAGLMWGDPGLPGGVLKVVPGGDLPDIPACDPEAHSSNVVDEVSRTTRALVFSMLTGQANFPHVAHGGPAQDDEPVYESWPNGRDILHQAMNIQSIRRAYDGGLRLMFAATVDSQALGLAMHTTAFPPPFVPSRDVERESAEAQLLFIQSVVSANSDWMEIATTPEQAEDAIRANRLAIILTLEMDGLRLEDVQYFVQTYGVGSIVPIHLIDNDVGGTAAYNDLFNSATALLGSMFGYPNRYISVQPDSLFATGSAYDFHFAWPVELAIVGPSFNVQPVDFSTAGPLGYTSYPLCSPAATGIPGESGILNTVGLREPQTISELMKLGLIVDVAHMGYRSTSETIDLALATCSYPLVDTHTSIHLRNQPRGGSERDIYEDQADYIATHQGVLGYGSGGRTSLLTCAPEDEGVSTIASARGGPLTTFDQRQQRLVVQVPAGGRACSQALAESGSVVGLRVPAAGNPPDGAIAVAQITFVGGHQQNVGIAFNAVTTVNLDLPASSVTAISIGLLVPTTCQYGDAQSVDIQSVDILGPSGTTLLSIGPGQLGAMGGGSNILATVGPIRSSFTAYSRCPSDTPPICDPAQDAGPSTEPNEHLRIRVRSGTKDLKSSSPLIAGARVTGSFCLDGSCQNAADPCDHPDFTMTPAGGWPKGLELDQYVSFARPAAHPISPEIIELCVTQRDLAIEPWEVDEVDVDVVEDPMRLWTAEYGALDSSVFGGRQGAVALGTDFNGLAPQFAFTDFTPAYEDDAEGCGETTGDAKVANAQYGDATSGGTFTLKRPLRIGTTPLCLPQRGLASYGMFPEFFAAVYHYNPDVYRSLFSSAAATIAAWRAARTASLAFATNPTTCAGPDAGSAEGSAGEGGPAGNSADASTDGGTEGGP